MLGQLAEVFQTKLVDQTLNIPLSFGQGFFKLVNLPYGLQSLVYNIHLNDDLLFVREKNDKEFYLLSFDQISRANKGSIRINSEDLTAEQLRNTAIYLTSFLFDVELGLQKDTTLTGIRILLPVQWMNEYLELGEKEDILEKYVSLKTAGIWYMPVDIELKELLDEILSTERKPLLFTSNRMMRIVEKFFDWLYNQLQYLSPSNGISRADILAAQKVEAILTKDITALPPTIKELAREIAMSESKLKKIFKSVYGMPPYEYFQKQRMQKAMTLLKSGVHSIKDVGYTLGYANLSNFTLAFKKVYGVLPSVIIKESK
ncbi:helix-turn-helix transcriptional regulator [Flavisolibacter tropicus]|uniref:helix-turn-helix transcriptional regulator n=1 Tax=Flavisolibacter tropicus TaxID=1492898 RepID=UPI001314BEFB|nr:helix-turn-helix transcriptional regulator [Flavisolibacter tropicus]